MRHALAMLALTPALAHAGPFADEVVEYRPAPGQFVNEPSPFTEKIFNDPTKALGAPLGGGAAAPSNDKLVTLGAFGGSLTLSFAQTVRDDRCNPFGLDAIVFGNAFWGAGDPMNPAGEPAIIEISLDTNGNGLADDTWFLIPGSHLTAPHLDGWTTQPWDNDPGTPIPPEITAWYPSDALYDFVPPGFPSTYDTATFLLPLAAMTDAVAVGYADRSPVLILGDLDADDIIDDATLAPADFYTVPDNPHVAGITPGSGGGDAFDIAWAVDPATGESANLSGFDFIRVSSAISAVQGPLAEVSAEIGAVADVQPNTLFFDIDASATVDIEDLYTWHTTPTDLTGEGAADSTDRWLLQRCVRRAEESDMGASP